jgi:hypothetical protein
MEKILDGKKIAKRIRENLDFIRLGLKNLWENLEYLWFKENPKVVFQYILEIIKFISPKSIKNTT